MKISIKGQTYEVKRKDIIDNDIDTVGQMNKLSKEILISINSCLIDFTILHELVHAYLWECGFANQCGDEDLVNWITGNALNIVDCYNKLKDIELKKGVSKNILIKGQKYNIEIIDMLDIYSKDDSFSSGVYKSILFSYHCLDFKLTLLNELIKVHLFETGLLDDYKDGKLADWLSVNILEIDKNFKKIKSSKLYQELKK